MIPSVTPARVDEVAPIRVLVFLLVIAGHVLPNIEQGGVSGEVARLCQVGKYAFLTISAFIAVWMQLRRPLTLRAHLRRRLPAIVVPFLVWSIVFAAIAVRRDALSANTVARFVIDVLTGDGEQHLYFVLLVVQLTVVTPLLTTFVRRTEGKHIVIAIAAAVLQLAIAATLHYAPTQLPSDVTWRLLPTWAGFAIIGALAAVHIDRITSVVRAHTVAALAIGAAGLVTHVAVFAIESSSGVPLIADRAGQAISPAHVLWGLSFLPAVLAVSTTLMRLQPRGTRTFRLVAALADRGYGVYLVHPLMITIVVTAMSPLALGTPARIAIALPCTVLGTLAVVELLIRSPFGKWTVGRTVRRTLPVDA